MGNNLRRLTFREFEGVEIAEDLAEKTLLTLAWPSRQSFYLSHRLAQILAYKLIPHRLTEQINRVDSHLP
jgi:hypothetical protein